MAQYEFHWAKELFWAVMVAAVVTVGQVISATDFGMKDNWDTLAEWSTWGYTLLAAVGRSIAVAVTTVIVGVGSRALAAIRSDP